MYKIVIIDDEEEILKDRSKIIRDLGFECFAALNGQEGVKIIKQEYPDVVFTDLKMPKYDGFYVLKKTTQIDPDIPVILFTGYGTIKSAVKAMKLGAYDYLQKPFPIEMMEIVLKKAIEFRKLKQENIILKSQIKETYQLKDFIGKSKAIKDIAKKVIKVAQSDANVLISGESGTGKEIIAMNIHFHSQRKKKSFIPLDCNALPPTLIESEIFGYEKGAFTGAVKAKPGVMELAEGGTLFLDEIAELDIQLQTKLLRVIQERQFRRVGGTKTIKVDLRIISATNRNPELAIKENNLRKDLYYRLNVVPIVIPPLRYRKEDVPLLVHHFMNLFNPSCVREIREISNDAMRCLIKYHWPGNVRELQNIIENTMSLTDRDIISYEDLPDILKEIDVQIIDESFEELNYKQAKDKYLNQFNKEYISRLLERNNGNVSKVARKAGISRWTIYRILKDTDNEHFSVDNEK